MLTLVIFLCYYAPVVNSYNDDIPDPDFLNTRSQIPNSGDMAGNIQYEFKESMSKCNSNDEIKLPGFFKFIIKEVLKSDLLTEREADLFNNPDFTDPQTLSEIIVGLISNGSPCHVQNPINLFSSPLTYLNALPKYTIYQIASIYVMTMFVLCYMNQKCRNFIVEFHLLVIYLCAVYSKMNKQYSDIKGRKMAAITSMPSHCKEGFSLQSIMSHAWSKFQIGDQCKKYNQEVLSDPFYEIEYHKCFIYPLISVLSVPLIVLGEELGPFLENILSPFPFHLQIIILVFVTCIVIAIVYTICSLKGRNGFPVATQQANDKIPLMINDLLNNINEMKKDMKVLKESSQMNSTDIMVVNNDSFAQDIVGNSSRVDHDP